MGVSGEGNGVGPVFARVAVAVPAFGLGETGTDVSSVTVAVGVVLGVRPGRGEPMAWVVMVSVSDTPAVADAPETEPNGVGVLVRG
jgi:hypothetical protein